MNGTGGLPSYSDSDDDYYEINLARKETNQLPVEACNLICLPIKFHKRIAYNSLHVFTNEALMRKSKYTKELLEPLVNQSLSFANVIRLLGLRLTGGNYRM